MLLNLIRCTSLIIVTHSCLKCVTLYPCVSLDNDDNDDDKPDNMVYDDKCDATAINVMIIVMQWGISCDTLPGATCWPKIDWLMARGDASGAEYVFGEMEHVICKSRKRTNETELLSKHDWFGPIWYYQLLNSYEPCFLKCPSSSLHVALNLFSCWKSLVIAMLSITVLCSVRKFHPIS